jgi:hypothetical protein
MFVMHQRSANQPDPQMRIIQLPNLAVLNRGKKGFTFLNFAFHHVAARRQASSLPTAGA